MDPSGSADQKPFIRLHHISKRFGSLWANQDISLDLHEGEIHAIVGENGAGKSTLMKILNGHLQADAGEIECHGHRVHFHHPQDAMRAGIGMAYQQSLLFPQLTAIENIIVGFEPGRGGWLNRRQAEEELLQLCRSVGFDLPLNATASELPFAQRQQIEILRLLYRKVKVLILDEPTSLLSPPETERFLRLLKSLQAAGHTILFISHRLGEVFAIADRVSVLTRGRLVGSCPIAELNPEHLIRLVMSGGRSDGILSSPNLATPEALAFQTESHPDAANHPKPSPTTNEYRAQRLGLPTRHSALMTQHTAPGTQHSAPSTQHTLTQANPPSDIIKHPTSDMPPPKSPIRHPPSDIRHPTSDIRHPISAIRNPKSEPSTLLELRSITTLASPYEARLEGFSLTLFEGEVFGLGGVVGNGQRTLALLLSGMLPAERGEIFFSGEAITHLPISGRAAKGLRWLPANPPEEALLPLRTIWENMLLGRQRQRPFQHYGWLEQREINSWATEHLVHQEVVHGALTDPVNSLSGGNLQKVALSRVLAGTPRLVILEQPSRGLDLRAQERLRNQVRAMNSRGVTFLLISYDLDELLALSHRIGVLYRGHLMGIAKREEASPELLGRWMLGLGAQA